MRRFALSGRRRDLVVCGHLLELAVDDDSKQVLLAGFERAFKGRSLAGIPEALGRQLNRVGGGSLSLRVRRGNPSAIAEALRVIADPQSDATLRVELIQTFGEVPHEACTDVLLKQLMHTAPPTIHRAILTTLMSYPDKRVGRQIVDQYTGFPVVVREAAQTLLASRRDWSLELLSAVDRGDVPSSTVPPSVLRKMSLHASSEITSLTRVHWGTVGGLTTEAMRHEIRRLTSVVSEGSGDPYQGKQLFTKTCGKCHLLFGQGGRIGPDLTTYKRDDHKNMLLNIVNPSAEIRAGFETLTIVTEDGRVISGFLVDEDQQTLIIRGDDGQNITIRRDQIADRRRQPKSLMPEQLLTGLGDQQVRNLFAYLRSTQPLNN
jgi:putative heme-binding domain-containing protein